MVENIEYRNSPCSFQYKLRNDMRKTSSIDKILIPAEKTRKLYAASPDKYANFLKDNITQKSKVADTSLVAGINKKQTDIFSKVDIQELISHFYQQEVVVTIKDHKDNSHRQSIMKTHQPCQEFFFSFFLF